MKGETKIWEVKISISSENRSVSIEQHSLFFFAMHKTNLRSTEITGMQKNAEGDILVFPSLLFSFLSSLCFVLLLLPLVPSSPSHVLQYEHFKKRPSLWEMIRNKTKFGINRHKSLHYVQLPNLFFARSHLRAMEKWQAPTYHFLPLHPTVLVPRLHLELSQPQGLG